MTTHDRETERPPRQVIDELLGGFQASQALHVTARLGILDVVHESPRNAEEIARTIGAHAPSLRRLLRHLVTLDILTESADGTYVATAMAGFLRSDHPQSAHPWALLLGSPLAWRPWGELHGTIMTGQPAFELVYGEPFFTYLQHSPDDAATVNAAMSNDTGATAANLDAYDFSGLSTIVDVGGGHGALLRAILERYPEARGVLFDLPSVVATASELRTSEVASRCEVVGGDMFRSVPAGGDAYILKRIVHDWNDEKAIQILQNCRAAMGDQGKVLVIEQVVQAAGEAPDLMMLVLVSGRERTEDEFRALYAAAGLNLTRVVPAGGHAVIEGVPMG